MATLRDTIPPSVRRAQMMREAWAPVGQRLSTGLRSVLDFLVAYPPFPQGAYYLLTGLWPLISLHTFQMVTGPKVDLWLVQTVGALVTVIGATLVVAAWRRQGSPEVFCLALGTALALIAVDVTFVVQRRISLVYLLDAAVEVGLVALWLYGWQTGRSELRRCAPQDAPVARVVPGDGVPTAPQAIPVAPVPR
jgi:hypothetical protein